jgi:long-chain fatty acid transport protein
MNLFKISAISIVCSSILLASGYKVNSQSSNSNALSGAYVANSSKAEASYYNPANMSFNDDKSFAQANLMYINLTSVNYKDNRTTLFDSSSKTENFFIPTMFFSSKDYDGIRYGFSMTSPFGLSKRWDDSFAKTFAQEFSVNLVELNPSVAYKISNNFSIAAGLRGVYAKGKVQSDGVLLGNQVARDMQGDAMDYGYNLALAYKPTSNMNFSATYRSNINLNVQGDAKLYYNNTLSHDSAGEVSIPLPATLSLAYAQKLDKTTVEFTFDRTYWSKYKEIDFNYSTAVINPVLKALFDDVAAKDWKDTNTYRLGLTYKYSDDLDLMAGFAIEKTPVPNSSLSFDLPDSNANVYSLGFDYSISDTNSFSASYLFYDAKNRKVVNDTLNGEFSNTKANSVVLSYKFEF